MEQPPLFALKMRVAAFTGATTGHERSLRMRIILSRTATWNFLAKYNSQQIDKKRRATLASVKHASESTLEGLSAFLDRLRSIDGLVEKRPGVFYRRSKAFLHFHEDPSGIFVDIRLNIDDPFTRLPVTTRSQQSELISTIKRALQPE